MPAAPDGIMLPKPRSGEDVHSSPSRSSSRARGRAGLADGATRIIAIATETAGRRCCPARTYVGASPRLAGADLGRGGSLGRLGADANREADGALHRALPPGARL